LKSMGLDLELLNTFIAQIFDAKNCRSLLKEINFETGVDGEFFIAGTPYAKIGVNVPADGDGGVKINGGLYISGSPIVSLNVEIGPNG
ncbi:TPA: phage tail protein I, partial [Escherichia coli]|nr:phage tail protein I [Escherichia coli]